MNSKETREELIRRVRAAGESMMKNAESIVGNEKSITRLSISVYVHDLDEAPEIHVARGFVPERYFIDEEVK